MPVAKSQCGNDPPNLADVTRTAANGVAKHQQRENIRQPKP